jgi:hypothetical protein
MIEKYAIHCFTKHHKKHQLVFQNDEELDNWGWEDFYEYIGLVGDTIDGEWCGFFDEHMKEIDTKNMRAYVEESGIDFVIAEYEEFYETETEMVLNGFINSYMCDEDNVSSLTEKLKELYRTF